MLQATRQSPMDANLLKPRGEFVEDSSGSGAETRPRKRFQRGTTSENDDPLKRTGMPFPFGRGDNLQNDSKATGTRRRSTLREPKTPLLGPRPLESGKRVISDSHYQQPTTNFLRRSSPVRPNANDATHSMNNTQRLGNMPSTIPTFADQRVLNKPMSSDFLPSVNFDDFHESITGLNDMPIHAMKNDSTSSLNSAPNTAVGLPQPPQHGSKVSRSESLVRRFSNARKPVGQTHARVDSSTMPPPATTSNRGRRQSTLASTLTQNPPSNSRPPRKSVGPGYLPQSISNSRSASRDSRIPPSNSQPSLLRSNSITRPTQPASSLLNGTSASTAAGRHSRNARTKSLQPPPRGQSQGNLGFAVGTNGDGEVMNSAQASPRLRNQRAQTPSSGGSNANKRLSTVYVGGLGARTISPTDARRLRRLSTAPKHPAVPQLPTAQMPSSQIPSAHLPSAHLPPGHLPPGQFQPSHFPPSHIPPAHILPAHVPSASHPSASQPELMLFNRHMTQSPAATAQKTSTSSSSRNTPEFSRKQVNSVQSMSSSSSFNSLRLSASNGPRSSQVLSASRLPAPKPRNVHSSVGFVNEEVPPVPAIPKAYESPKDQHHPEPSYFSRKAGLSESEDSSSKGPISKSAIAPLAPPTLEDANRDSRLVANTRPRRGLTIGSGQDPEKQPAAGPNLNKKNLQPLRLPPLNLLPLSAPTANRIASLPASDDDPQQAQTPPPKRNAKTPSTPMTASRATFFGRAHNEEDDFGGFDTFRSSSSAHPTRPNGLDMRELQFGLSAPIPVPGARNNASPFASNSLPKLIDYGPFSTSSSSATPVTATPTEANFQSQPFLRGLDVEPYEANLPSPKIIQQLAQPSNPSARTSSSDEPSTPASTTSLRRKLSLTWKRSSSKASQRAQAQAEKDEAKAKQNEMPPPKIPASATWSSRSSQDNGSIRLSFDTKTRKVSNSLQHGQIDNKVQNQHLLQHPDSSAQKGNPTLPPPPYSEHHRRPIPRSSSSSILTPVQRMLGGKGSINTLRSRNLDTNLDKDDLAADKVMEKLASKRKDFEQAAREVDDLRKRAHPKDRVTPSQAIQMVNLNIFERGEIIDYKEVFFCGTRNAKKIIGNADHASTNFGYDDERGDYNITVGDHLAYRYEVVDILGKGSFGQVVRCIDHKTGGLVAVKIIRNKKRFHQQALVEVNILQKLREWDPENKHSMINFIQHFYFRGHLCISTELLGINLYEFIKAYEFKGFPVALIRRFTKQILSSLILLKSKRVIHCDLKPENILLAHPMHSEIKVIDFGSSCFENEKVYTYIQSRFYRSPEVILGMSYGIPIDMWSLGCILAELFSGYPIFPGENEQEQLACIMEIFGPPEKHLIEKSSRKKLFFDSMGKPRVTVSSKGRRRRPSSKTLQSALKCDDEPFLEFLAACLRWDPEKRLRPDQAMQHEFITGIKRAPQTSQRPIARAPVNTSASAQNSPVKRFNAPNPTPQRAQASREVSGTIRPLPEPPAPGFRNASVGSASPVKSGQPNRRHSTMVAPVPGTQPSGPAKRVHTTTGSTTTATSGLASVIANSRNQSQQRVISGRGDLTSAAAVVSLRGGR